MNEKRAREQLSRRQLLKLGGQGALLVAAGSLLPVTIARLASRLNSNEARAARRSPGLAAPASSGPAAPASSPMIVDKRLVATDGFIKLIGREDNPLYVFGFREAPLGAPISGLDGLKGPVQAPAPLIWGGEDVEHVQRGMVGIVFVRPAQNKPPINEGEKYAYNDGDGSTRYDREFALLMQDVWTTPHDNLAAIQETVWSDFDADYWVINGRAYPDTLKPNNNGLETGADPDLESQPISSLIQANEEEMVLLRLVNLGYEQHAMQLAGIPMKVIGEDATWLGPKGSGNAAYFQPMRGDTTYFTNVVDIGPGESRDVLFQAPPYLGDGSAPDVYLFKNRNLTKLVNAGAPGLGGMATEVWVYPEGTVGAQEWPNQTVDITL